MTLRCFLPAVVYTAVSIFQLVFSSVQLSVVKSSGSNKVRNLYIRRFLLLLADYCTLTGFGDLWQCLFSKARASSNPQEINNYQTHHPSLRFTIGWF